MKKQEFKNFVKETFNRDVYESIMMYPDMYELVNVDGEMYIKFTEEIYYDVHLTKCYMCATCNRVCYYDDINGFDENDNYICNACRHDNYDYVCGEYIKRKPITEYQLYRIAHRI